MSCMKYKQIFQNSTISDKNKETCDAKMFNQSHIEMCHEFIYKTDEVNLVNEVFIY